MLRVKAIWHRVNIWRQEIAKGAGVVPPFSTVLQRRWLVGVAMSYAVLQLYLPLIQGVSHSKEGEELYRHLIRLVTLLFNFCTVDPKEKPSWKRSAPSVNYHDAAADVIHGMGVAIVH